MRDSSKKFYIRYKGKYCTRLPYWNGGEWTDDLSKATKYTDRDFFKKNYPNFEIVEMESDK